MCVQLNVYNLFLNNAVLKKKRKTLPRDNARIPYGVNKPSCLLLAHTELPFPLIISANL